MHRWFVAFGLILFGSVSHAEAQVFDTPTLRGSSPFVPAPMQYSRWSGAYAGGQVGFAWADNVAQGAFSSVDIFSSANPFTAPLGRVSSWANFGQTDARGTSYGAFIGYNSQWEDAIVGVELNYNHSSSLSGSGSASRCHSATNPNCLGALAMGDGNLYDVNITATASTKITDYGTLRARGGWAFGDFMPYALAGVALARVEFKNSATASGTPVTIGTPFVQTEQAAHASYVWGYALGVGLDYMVAPSVFLRGEYEFIKLNNVDGLRLSINTARVAGAFRF